MKSHHSPPSRLRESLASDAATVVQSEHRFGSAQRELQMIATIDAAHTLMLAQTSLISTEAHTALATVQWQLLGRDGLAALHDVHEPRGIYVAYENHLIEQVGIEVGGLAHLGRSRNDINATLFALHMRELYAAVAQATLELRESLIRAATRHATTPFVVYSQFQPALPGTFGYYLAGVESALARGYRHIEAVTVDLAHCPMGGGGGAGTELAIEPERTANYLGFQHPVAHALDAIASRDVAVSFTGGVANLGIVLSRVAQDLQLWTTRENALVQLPDSLVGTSSMMPQKRNPYLLEKIKGKCARLLAGWTSAAAPSLKVPFSNAIEVGTESILDVARTAHTAVEALTLMRLIVDAARVDNAAVERSRRQGVVEATMVSNAMVSRGDCSFREAHDRVGAAIRTALDDGEDPATAVASLVEDDLGDSDPALRMRYGAGPGAFSLPNAMLPATRVHHAAQRELQALKQRWQAANDTLMAALEAAAIQPRQRDIPS